MAKMAVRRKIGKRPKIRPVAARTRADKVLAQGTGKAVSQAFGASRAVGLEGWDAFHPAHLPLPRSVGPYTVVRTTALIKSSAAVNVVGTFATSGTTTNGRRMQWTTVGMLSSVTESVAVDAANNAYMHTIPFPGVNKVGSGFTAVPSAVSVQVMNPNPLQSTEGIVAAAVCPTSLDLRGRTETWDSLSSEFISYMRPRLLSAGKLTLRGVQLDSYPLNMAALAEFRQVTSSPDGVTTYSDGNTDAAFTEGFAPIVIANNGGAESPLPLDYLVTVEWRVRFDIGNPAVASHCHHGVTSDIHWDKLIQRAVARGNGALDIVERVANQGAAIATMAGRARSIGGAISALF